MPNITIKDEAHWLAVRDEHIGGSDVAALFSRWLLASGESATLHAYEDVPVGAVYLGSCSPYSNAYTLWTTKSGKVQPSEWNPSERMQAGTYLEPAMAEWARNKWAWRLRKVRRYHQHPTISGWGASVDYEVHGPGMEPVEFKNIDFLIARDSWVIEDEEVVVPPLHIILQTQHYIGAREAKGAWIVACIGGNELVRGHFDRHEPTIDRIAEAIVAFWDGVSAGVAPNTAPFDAVKEEFAYGQAVSEKEAIDLTGDDAAAMLARQYVRWKKHLEFTDTHMDHLKGKLALKLGSVSRGRGDGFKITWPVIERGEKMIAARMQSAKTYRGAFTVTQTEK